MTDPDHRMARRARRGDRRAVEALYDRYRRRLFGFLFKATRDQGRAEELFQEVWMRVIQSIDRFDPARGPFRAWLFQIASNATIDRARRDAVRMRSEIRNTDDRDGPPAVELYPHPGPDPEQLSAARQAGRSLDAALGELPEEQRTAVLLRYQQELTYIEIAAALAVPEGTVKTRVHRALNALRTRMKEPGDA